MMPSRSKVKASKALVELRAAACHLGDIRPGAPMEPEEFFEACEIQRSVRELVERLDKLVKGGLL